MTVYIPASSLMITQMEVFLGSEWCSMRYFGYMQGLVFFYLILFAPFQKNKARVDIFFSAEPMQND